MTLIRKLTEKSLIIASHNADKLKEIFALLGPLGLSLISAKQLALPEPEENGANYLENALIKAQACCAATGLPVLSDDSGIEVEALDWGPGVDTAPYTKNHGGLKQVFDLWAKLPNLKNHPRARFVCVLVLAWPDGHYQHFDAIIDGRLTFPPRGHHSHGYDPIFIPDGHQRTVAEMNLGEKNSCSHRYRACKKLMASCLVF